MKIYDFLLFCEEQDLINIRMGVKEQDIKNARKKFIELDKEGLWFSLKGEYKK